MANYSGKFKLPRRAENSYKMGYDLELDVSPELGTNAVSYMQSITGIIRWMTELGRIDLMNKVSLLTSHLVLPREGYLAAAVCVIAYVLAEIQLQIGP